MARSLRLKAYVDEGLPGPEHFEVIDLPAPDAAAAGEGGILVQLTALSADPYLRIRIRSPTAGPGFGSIPLGDAMSGFVVGKVLASNGNEKWEAGDLFGANLPFTTVQALTAAALQQSLLWKLTGLLQEAELSKGLGILGMPGSTAYGGLIDILQPKEGQTIFISAASGAVGSLVGMLAKNVFKCTVIGSCGGAEKCALIKERFGYDHAIDYKAAAAAAGGSKAGLLAALRACAPEGIDMYFENVGGAHFEAAFESLKVGGRIAVCGGISSYNDAATPAVAIDPMRMVYTAQRIEGFVCSPWLTHARGNFLSDMHEFMRQGHVVAEECSFSGGIDAWPSAFQALFTSKGAGKIVVPL